MKGPRYGIRTGIILLVAGALLLNVLLIVLFGSALMERYYTARVERQMKSAYALLEKNGSLTMALAAEIENKGMDLTLVNRETGALYYASRPRNQEQTFLAVQTVERCRRMLQDGQNLAIAYEDSDFGVPQGGKLKSGSTCYLAGIVGNCYVELSLPMESVSTMADLSQEFQIIVCLVVLAVMVLLILALSPRIVRSLRQMAAAADRIAGLDFSGRCQNSRCRELNELGGGLNAMSDKLQDYTGQLVSANERLKADIAERERAEAARKRLIAGLSHDLKTPIALISGYADGLQAGMAKTEAQRKEYCAVIGEESDRMAEILGKMLALSRLECGAIRPEPEVFDLSELLRGLCGLFRVEMGKAGIMLETDIPDSTPVETDYTAAEQVLTNYLQNAVYHMGEGKRLRVSVRETETGAEAAVYNSAPPIADTEALWEPFYRGESSRQRKHGETGLGLSIVRGNMDLLSLPYGVRNLEGGVEFYAVFPAAPPEE
ncbi:MAG: HAMP domain-containing sensor histidine kinase [Oscillospiraceae bacterium]|nr:HAMP domain-containing sensor histidine kinase [Oscillospiraceae bacterium]